jgi:DNA-binding GntR family transcriptional regulator
MSVMTEVTPTTIAARVVEAILAQKLAPGERLGEQQLAETFGVSRTMVREALMQLQARGFVEVQSRRGWYVVEPSAEEARDAFAARRIIEAGILAESGRPLSKVIRKLREHIADEKRAIAGADAATRAFLLADFHVWPIRWGTGCCATCCATSPRAPRWQPRCSSPRTRRGSPAPSMRPSWRRWRRAR